MTIIMGGCVLALHGHGRTEPKQRLEQHEFLSVQVVCLPYFLIRFALLGILVHNQVFSYTRTR